MNRATSAALERDLQNSEYCKSAPSADFASPTKHGAEISRVRRFCCQRRILQVPLQSARDFRGTCKIRNIASRPHRPILQVQQNTVPRFRESAVSAANGEFCKSLFSPAPERPTEVGLQTEVCPTCATCAREFVRTQAAARPRDRSLLP